MRCNSFSVVVPIVLLVASCGGTLSQHAVDSAEKALEAAKSAVAVKKKELKTETEALLTKMPKMLRETKRLWFKAVTGKEYDAALKLVKNQIIATEDSISEVKVSLKAGDYLDASIQAKAIISKLSSYQTEIQRH